jgi:hypothetical protein
MGLRVETQGRVFAVREMACADLHVRVGNVRDEQVEVVRIDVGAGEMISTRERSFDERGLPCCSKRTHCIHKFHE